MKKLREIIVLLVLSLTFVMFSCEQVDDIKNDPKIVDQKDDQPDEPGNNPSTVIRDQSGIDETFYNGFIMTYEDKFDGDSLNNELWTKGLPYDWNSTSLNDESQSYSDENVIVEDGDLVLKLEKRTVQGHKSDEIINYDYASGCISSKSQMIQTYGMFEMRAKLPSAHGSWPAFWLMPENENIYAPVGAEIDIFENLAIWGDEIQFGLHYNGYGEEHQHWAAPMIDVPNIFDEYHTYSLVWNPLTIDLYIDGELVATYDGNAIPSTEHYLIINAAMGGWGGNIDDSALPDYMEIDYVRLYQYEDMEAIITQELESLISEKTEASGEDFETTTVDDITGNAVGAFRDDLIEITEDVYEVVSGDKSLKVDSTTVDTEWNEIYKTASDIMLPNKKYKISLDYRVLAKEDGAYFYSIVKPLSGVGDNIGWTEMHHKTGVQNTFDFIIQVEDVSDYYLVLGIYGQASYVIDNINIEEYSPEAVGETFEEITIEEIVANQATNMVEGIYSITEDSSEVISGLKSYKIDTMSVANHYWNEGYISGVGQLTPGKTYIVEFDYKILDMSAGGSYSAIYYCAKSLSGLPQKYEEVYYSAGDEGRFSYEFTLDSVDDLEYINDYYSIIGVYGYASMIIDNFLVEEITE